jgi:hypothetical protein
MDDISQGEQPTATMNGADCRKVQEKRPRSEALKEYEVRIKFFTLGCVVSVGCREVPFTSIAEGMQALNAYVADPDGEAQKWNELFRKGE